MDEDEECPHAEQLKKSQLQQDRIFKGKTDVVIAEWIDSKAKVIHSKSTKFQVSLGWNKKGRKQPPYSQYLGINFLSLFEAVYLLDIGQLELYVDGLPVSLQQAYQMLDLQSPLLNKKPTYRLSTCTH